MLEAFSFSEELKRDKEMENVSFFFGIKTTMEATFQWTLTTKPHTHNSYIRNWKNSHNSARKKRKFLKLFRHYHFCNFKSKDHHQKKSIIKNNWWLMSWVMSIKFAKCEKNNKKKSFLFFSNSKATFFSHSQFI